MQDVWASVIATEISRLTSESSVVKRTDWSLSMILAKLLLIIYTSVLLLGLKVNPTANCPKVNWGLLSESIYF